MKILYLVTSLEGGGAQARIPRIVTVLRECGHEVDVIACEPRGMGAAHLLDAAGITYRLLYPAHRSKWAQIRAFTRLARANRPDVIWTMLSRASVVGAVTGALCGVPVVSWKNCADRALHTRLFGGLSRLWIADSQSVADYLFKQVGIRPARIVTWPLFEQMRFTQWPRPWDGVEPLHIGSMGRLHAQKGYDLLIAAVARWLHANPQRGGRLRVTILGDGPQREQLQGLVDSLGMRSVVTLAGAVADVRPFLASLHVYAQPSRYEGMCLAAHEAMSAGLAVIATPVGELGATLRASGGGVLLGQDVVGSLAAAIDLLLRDPGKLADMGRAARRHIEQVYGEAGFAQAGRAVASRVESLVKAN